MDETVRRQWWWLALGVVAVVVAIAAGLFLAGDDDSRTEVGIGAEADPSGPSGAESSASTTLATTAPTGPPLGVIDVQPGAPGEPVLLAVTADAIEGTVTVTFDVPVQPAGDVLKHMGLFTHGNDGSCPFGQGNAHHYLSGAGTPTITFSATYLMPGTSYISMIPGVVLNAETGQSNVPVGCTAVDAGAPAPPQLVRVSADGSAGAASVGLVYDRWVENGDATQVEVFDDADCTQLAGRGTEFLHEPHIGRRDESAGFDDPVPFRQASTVDVATTGLRVGSQYVRLGAGVVVEPFGDHSSGPSGCLPLTVSAAPVLLSAYGDLGSLTLTFDQPVDPVAPNPTEPPPGGSEGLNTMYLTVYGPDPTCATPAGNAHYFIDGIGTATVTVEATSIVAPTTYIRIAEGFVRSVADGTLNRAVGCTAVSIAG